MNARVSTDSVPRSSGCRASTAIVEFAANVIVPDQVLAFARLRRAPSPSTPVPLRLVIGWAIIEARSVDLDGRAGADGRVAGGAEGGELWTRITPALTVVAPM